MVRAEESVRGEAGRGHLCGAMSLLIRPRMV